MLTLASSSAVPQSSTSAFWVPSDGGRSATTAGVLSKYAGKKSPGPNLLVGAGGVQPTALNAEVGRSWAASELAE